MAGEVGEIAVAVLHAAQAAVAVEDLVQAGRERLTVAEGEERAEVRAQV